MRQELVQVVHESIRSSHSLNIAGLGHIAHCFDLFWIWFQTILCDQVCHVGHIFAVEVQFLLIELCSFSPAMLEELL